MKVVVVSGGFDPVHSGHLSYINEAKELGDILIVALNSDDWLKKKKGEYFLEFSERKEILENLTSVDRVLEFDDSDGSCIEALKKIKKEYPDDAIIFCNGGDRNETNIPETSIEEITFKFGVGGADKKNSSSTILNRWKRYEEERLWGSFTNLYFSEGLKVKELIVKPNKGMSYQRHLKRNEIWLIHKGKCQVRYSKDSPEDSTIISLEKNDFFHVGVYEWHQIYNTNDEDCHIIELQYGSLTEEEDIERLEYYEE